jgi:hypothetical protein
LLEKVPPRAAAEQALPKKGLKDFGKAFLILTFLGYMVGCLADPFIFILYAQIAFLFITIFMIKTTRKDYISLSFWILLIVAFALKKAEISIVLGILFLVLFIGRSLLKEPRRRRIFSVASTALIGSFFFLFLLISHPYPHPLTDPSSESEAIQSLPYLSYVTDERNFHQDGVVEDHQNLSAPGINLYNSYYKAGAYLLDMSGKKLQTWLPPDSHSNWQYVTACDNGDVLVCIEDVMLMRLDGNSHILWQQKLRAHHDIAVAENNDIYTLASSDELVFTHFLPAPIINDYIVILSSDGTMKKNISLFNLLKKNLSLLDIIKIYSEIIDPRDFLWRVIKQKLRQGNLLRRETPFDVFHNNTITIAEKDFNALCKKGDVLISASHLDLIGIIDIEQQNLRWAWGPGTLEEQHDPTFLENGNILIFDNGTRREYSRIIELDPLKYEIVWEYHSFQPRLFFTDWGGSAQRLPNGNTLITETSKGRVFEITRDGKIVWEFLNPEKAENGKRATIYRMTRITDAHLQSMLLEKAKGQNQ